MRFTKTVSSPAVAMSAGITLSAMLSGCALLGAEEQQAAAPPDPCSTLAAFIRGQPDLVAGKFGGSLIIRVDGRKGSPLAIEPTDTLGSDLSGKPARFQDFKEDFARRYRATPELLAAAEKLAANGDIETSVIDGTTLHILSSTESVSNTQSLGRCTRFLFFDLHPKDYGKLVSDIPGNLIGASPDQNALLCAGAMGHLATVDAVPAFAVIDYGEQDYRETISFSSWLGGHWAKACRVTVTFETVSGRGIESRGALKSLTEDNGPTPAR